MGINHKFRNGVYYITRILIYYRRVRTVPGRPQGARRERRRPRGDRHRSSGRVFAVRRKRH